MEWLAENLGTILITLVLAVVVGLVIFKMVRDKKRGRSSCGCGCANCAMAGACRRKSEKNAAGRTG